MAGLLSCTIQIFIKLMYRPLSSYIFNSENNFIICVWPVYSRDYLYVYHVDLIILLLPLLIVYEWIYTSCTISIQKYGLGSWPLVISISYISPVQA